MQFNFLNFLLSQKNDSVDPYVAKEKIGCRASMKFIHISDIHLVSGDGPLNGCVPSDRLNKCIQDITKWHGDAKFCVISGDLSEFAEKGAYQSLKKKLLEFQIQCFLMIGNHDDRIYFNQFYQ